MRRIGLLLLMVVCIPVAAVWAQKKYATVSIKTNIYCDHCRECESCSVLLSEAVYAIKGVRRVDVLDTSMIIEVVYNIHKVTPDQIRQVVAAVGYDADELRATPEAYHKLDDCCRKR